MNKWSQRINGDRVKFILKLEHELWRLKWKFISCNSLLCRVVFRNKLSVFIIISIVLMCGGLYDLCDSNITSELSRAGAVLVMIALYLFTATKWFEQEIIEDDFLRMSLENELSSGSGGISWVEKSKRADEFKESQKALEKFKTVIENNKESKKFVLEQESLIAFVGTFFWGFGDLFMK